MSEVETEVDSRYDDIDVESVLERCHRQAPISFSRKTFLYQAPEFIKRLPSTEEVVEGSTVTFMCQIAGFPRPTVTWYRDEEVLGPDSRAKTEVEGCGIHSINIKDVSKCDAGIYKIHASNLEGSSKSMLYISVKARSKQRNKKMSKRSGNIARSPLFPAIIERVAEEQKETLESENLPESPLTPLYCTISRKAPVMWPVFLGDWAYIEDEALQQGEIEELDVGCEDVFDSEDMNVLTDSVEARRERTAEISSHHVKQNNEYIERINKTKDTAADSVNDSMNNDKGTLEDLSRHNFVFSDQNPTKSVKRSDTCDMINNNDKDVNVNYKRNDVEELSGSCYTSVSHQDTLHDTVSLISVHRSYAKGDSSSSVARRSPSPYSRSRNLIVCGNNCISDYTDTTTLQNLNNERLLHRMNKETSLCHWCYCYLFTFATTSRWDDILWEIILFICGSTFLALCFDLSPTTFIYYILIAMFIKMVLYLVLEDI